MIPLTYQKLFRCLVLRNFILSANIFFLDLRQDMHNVSAKAVICQFKNFFFYACEDAFIIFSEALQNNVKNF